MAGILTSSERGVYFLGGFSYKGGIAIKKKIIVVKIGTKCVIENEVIKKKNMEFIARAIARIREEKNIATILVVSGAVEIGKSVLKLEERPKKKIGLQRCAGVGQIGLISSWASELGNFGIISSQYLLTYQNFESEEERKNIVCNLGDDVENGIVPIVNFNDKIDSREVALDNDRLSSKIAAYANAFALIILTNDVDGLLDGENLVERIRFAEIEKYEKLCNGTGVCGTGGMMTKMKAAREIVGAGGECFIANVWYDIGDLLDGSAKCTRITK